MSLNTWGGLNTWKQAVIIPDPPPAEDTHQEINATDSIQNVVSDSWVFVPASPEW